MNLFSQICRKQENDWFIGCGQVFMQRRLVLCTNTNSALANWPWQITHIIIRDNIFDFLNCSYNFFKLDSWFYSVMIDLNCILFCLIVWFFLQIFVCTKLFQILNNKTILHGLGRVNLNEKWNKVKGCLEEIASKR